MLSSMPGPLVHMDYLRPFIWRLSPTKVREKPCGVGQHPLLCGVPGWRVHHAYRVTGPILVTYLLERMSTGVDPDTGKRDPWERWTGLTWDEVAMALRVRAHAQARPQARPEHVDLDAPGGGTWPWERKGTKATLEAWNKRAFEARNERVHERARDHACSPAPPLPAGSFLAPLSIAK